MVPVVRSKLIEAAARVYGEYGFRGATTRRIADEAGVNEITIFRLFGSKAALIDEAVRSSAEVGDVEPLPDEPVHPERELTAWCTAHLARLRSSRSLIRKTMGELEERPEAGPCVTEGTLVAAQQLRDYMIRLRRQGYVVWERAGGKGVDPYAAGAMLMGALFADAMGRDMMPEMYPQPAERAAAMYVRLFLRAISCRAIPRRAPRRKAAGRPHSPSTNNGR